MPSWDGCFWESKGLIIGRDRNHCMILSPSLAGCTFEVLLRRQTQTPWLRLRFQRCIIQGAMMGKSLHRSLKSQKALWKILEMVSMPRIAKFLHFCMHLSNLFNGPSSIGAVVDVFRYCTLWEIMLYSTKHHTLDFKWLHVGIRNHTTRELPKLSA